MNTPKTIANRIAKTITSKYNQNVTMIFVGGTGSGKSYAAISLALAVSKLVAEKKGGETSDYFNLDRNMSVIDIMKFFTVLDNAQKWNTVILDDAGIGVNARKFQDIINITVNNITQTYRTLNLFTILTVPEMYFVDKILRSLTDYYCEMEGMIAPNISRGRLFEIQRKSRLGTSGKLFYVYPRANQEKTVAIMFVKPPIEICTVYEKLREEGALEYKRRSVAEITDGEAKIGDKKEGKTPPWLNPKYIRIKRRVAAGGTITLACAEEEYSRSSFSETRTKEEAYLSSLSGYRAKP